MQVKAAVTALAARGDAMPLQAMVDAVLEWLEVRHLTLLSEAGFDDIRRAHNVVFVNVPAEGIRLTELAEAGRMSKQAMGELVDDLEQLRYFERVPDPADGRAKLIRWAGRGMAAHKATLAAFNTMEQELAAVVGADVIADLRAGLHRVFAEVVTAPR